MSQNPQNVAIVPQSPDVAPSGSSVLTEYQRLPTSGARTALPFTLEGDLYLAIPQLSEDIVVDGVLVQAPHMNTGNSDIDAIIYRWTGGHFVEHERLPTPGGEDMTIFQIDGQTYLATAGVRTGAGPYDMNSFARIYRRENGAWTPYQSIPTFAGKQLYYFGFDGRHFLGVAEGVTLPGPVARHPRTSRIMEWKDGQFEDFRVFEGGWGYNWVFFEVDGQRFLGYADHTSPSGLYRWDGEQFTPFQTLADLSGRAFKFFEQDNQTWLAFAAIDGDSTLYRWNGQEFAPHQTLGGRSGREFELIRTASGLYLVRICFILGTPAAPKTDNFSQIFQWKDGRFEVIEEFPTFGGTDASAFTAGGQLYLAVSNSLTADVRFRQDTIIYRVAL